MVTQGSFDFITLCSVHCHVIWPSLDHSTILLKGLSRPDIVFFLGQMQMNVLPYSEAAIDSVVAKMRYITMQIGRLIYLSD